MSFVLTCFWGLILPTLFLQSVLVSCCFVSNTSRCSPVHLLTPSLSEVSYGFHGMANKQPVFDLEISWTIFRVKQPVKFWTNHLSIPEFPLVGLGICSQVSTLQACLKSKQYVKNLHCKLNRLKTLVVVKTAQFTSQVQVDGNGVGRSLFSGHLTVQLQCLNFCTPWALDVWGFLWETQARVSLVRCRPFQRNTYISAIGMPCRQAVSGELASPSLPTRAWPQPICSVLTKWTGRKWKRQRKSATKKVNLMICATPWAKNLLWHIWMLNFEQFFPICWDDLTFPLPITSRLDQNLLHLQESEANKPQLLKLLKMVRSAITMLIGSVNELSKSIGSRVPRGPSWL